MAQQPKHAPGWARAQRAVGLAQVAQLALQPVAEAQGKVGTALVREEAMLALGWGWARLALG